MSQNQEAFLRKEVPPHPQPSCKPAGERRRGWITRQEEPDKLSTDHQGGDNVNDKYTHKEKYKNKEIPVLMYIGCNALWLMSFVHLKTKTKTKC